MTLETLLDDLAYGETDQVAAALQAVPEFSDELRQAIPPRLAEAAQRLAANPKDERIGGVFWMMFIAASLRLTETHADIVRLFTIDDDDGYALWGDLVTEDAKTLMADTFAGDTQALEALAGNQATGIWSRDAAINALGVLKKRGVVSLETLTAIYTSLRDLILAEARAIEVRGKSTDDKAILATGMLMTAGLELCESSLKPVLWPLVEADLCHESICGLDSIEAGFDGREHPFANWDRSVGDDVWAYVKDWSYFSEKPERGVVPEVEAADILRGAISPYDAQGEVHGTVRLGPKVGRNEPCTCGSGKKFKKCCGA